ncbi:methyl-accepting chemotaxis protein [Curvibacter lanceolatus]|uniref:methyl-accepting chemotaxis protein n=1 Tax=Curvibacter lanceolatus TaxID=86182 RepID=UPI00037D2A70|nr:methyl-accepting chemotaxis protein [Curvibacter lanceolatus]
MSLFRNLGISGRLYGVSLLLITALTALAISTWSQLLYVRDLAQSAGSVKVLQLELIASTELKVTQVLSDLRQALLMKAPKDTELAVQGIQAKRTKISKNDADYLKELRSQDSRDAFQRDWLQLQTVTWPVAEANLQLLKDGKAEEAQTMLINQTIPAFTRMQDWLITARSAQGKSLSQEVDAIGAAADSIRFFLVTLVVAISVGLLVFSWYIARLLRRRVTTSREVAERVRQGDFTVPVDDSVSDEFSPLLQSLSAMQDSLTTVVGTVRENAESVATASAQIAQGNQDLSQRTEEQASSLEETAASMEELGSTVRQTSDNANQANQLAKGATAVAIKGGQVVGQVVDTMRGINESSRKIADIIGVIDGIAFQTNILALNAAVEAARAGEQGRGFAVVASEVRSLAQRSAEAAKEIKALISASVERVEQGTQLVDQAGVTMSEIVASIQRVTDLMGEISSAGSEQNAGVSQVGQAVMQMDQVTQQNASLVEQSAAAAESLKAQALQLVQAVSVFRLAHDARAPQRALPAAATPFAGRPAASRRPMRSLAAPSAWPAPSEQDSF